MSREISLARRAPYALEKANVTLDVVEAWAPRLRDDRQRTALTSWLAGDSSELTGQRLNVTRERARQLVRFALRRIGYASRGELTPDTLTQHFKEPS